MTNPSLIGPGGKFLLITGPASLPVAMVIAHHTLHRYGAVAVFDPKMGVYIVVASHDADFRVGETLTLRPRN